MSTNTYFDELHARQDPFGYQHSWYEARKRALLLASLPCRRYRRGWEAGCSNGVLTRELASRCDGLLATDLSAAALQQARQSTRDLPHVRLQQARHPGQWPQGDFDLIVCSEMGYYLPSSELPALRDGLHAALAADGLLVACHWRVPFEQAQCSAEAVHATLGEHLATVFTYCDADFLLQGWARAPLSIAAAEGRR